MTIIWSFMMISGIVYSLITGSADNIIKIISVSCENIGTTMLSLIGILCFWNGIFNILKHTSISKYLSRVINKMLGIILKTDELSDEAKENISLNISTNMLGVGNAATATGIKAMEEMNKVNRNKEKATNNMTIFVLLNTASLQIFPTTIISLRQMYGSKYPSDILIAVWICSLISLIVGVIFIKILNKSM